MSRATSRFGSRNLVQVCLLILGSASTLLPACLVTTGPPRGRYAHRYNSPPPPPQEVGYGQPAPPPPPPQGGYEPAPPPPQRNYGGGPAVHSAPPAPERPTFSVRAMPDRVRRGEEVDLQVVPFQEGMLVYFGGRLIPKKTMNGMLRVTVPGDAGSGYFEVEVHGQRFQSNPVTVTP